MKAVIFDMDGVLVDSEPKNLEQLKGFYELHGTNVDDSFLHMLVGSSYDFTYRESVHVMGKHWDIDTFTQKFEAYVKEHAFRYDEVLNHGVKDILSYLKGQGYQCAVASSSTLEQIQTMVRVCGLCAYFDVILSGEMFAESKPNPEIYLTAAKNLKVRPEECLVIEDSSYGIEAGNAAGMKVLAYRDDRYGVDQSKAFKIIDGMADIKDVLENRM